MEYCVIDPEIPLLLVLNTNDHVDARQYVHDIVETPLRKLTRVPQGSVILVIKLTIIVPLVVYISGLRSSHLLSTRTMENRRRHSGPMTVGALAHVVDCERVLLLIVTQRVDELFNRAKDEAKACYEKKCCIVSPGLACV